MSRHRPFQFRWSRACALGPVALSLCAVALLFAACAPQQRSARTPALRGVTAISAFPRELSLVAQSAPHRLVVTATDRDGYEMSATAVSKFVSDQPAIVTVTPDGRVRPLQAGSAIITARFGGRTATVAVKVVPGAETPQSSFLNDVLPVLSKAGCNLGSCHAKADGQNGFKLTIFSYDPKMDYHEIVKDARGRRVFPALPEESLLLKKATLAVPHEGGLRLERDSPDYQTLVRWIAQGMPYTREQEPTLTAITSFPPERRYRPGSVQPLLVQAQYSDGSVRDVTDLADYLSNEKALATVDDSGVVNVGKFSGEGVIVARFMGRVAVSVVTVPAEKVLPAAAYAALPVNTPIDRLVYQRLAKLGHLPSDGCTDAEFIRRASLDAIGTLPTVEQTRAFLADKDPAKRTKFIDQLLEQPAWADHWGVKYGDLLRGNPSRVGVKPVFLLDQWIRDSFRQNKPYDQFVRELITAQGNTHKDGPVAVFRDKRVPDDAGAFVSQIFLGVRLECAKCHHHPSEKWDQKDYFQLAAFFRSVKRKGQGISAPISGEPEQIWFAPGGSVKHPVTGEEMKPRAPDGPELVIPEERDPRSALVDWMTQPDNPLFARAVVNRVWSHYFGRGIVDPVDDLRASNPPTNEPLLDWLAKDFVAHRYDLKHLMRTILQSHVYQLSSWPNETNAADTKYHSRNYRRRLPAEVLLDAVNQVAGASDTFDGLPVGTRALQTWNHKLNNEFMDAFGRPNSSAECPCERDVRPSVVQALHLMNSSRLQTKLGSAEGRVAQLAKRDVNLSEMVTDLYLAAYCRPPAPDELDAALKAFVAPGASRQSALEDILWALLNSAEFVFNH